MSLKIVRHLVPSMFGIPASATFLNISEATLRRAIKEGQANAVRVRYRWMLSVDELNRIKQQELEYKAAEK